MLIVLDTNVLVSAMLKRTSKPAQILDAVLAGKIRLNSGRIAGPGDLPFAEAAAGSGAEVLVTGNLKHFSFLAGSRIKVLLPDEFIRNYPDPADPAGPRSL